MSYCQTGCRVDCCAAHSNQEQQSTVGSPQPLARPLPPALPNAHNPKMYGRFSPLRKPKMKYPQRLVFLAMAGVVAVGITASGCATPWFENKPKGNTDSQPSA